MSLEDFSSPAQSDESDNEAEKLWSDGECDDVTEVDYLDLVFLHDELTNFENIYCNNEIIDMEHRLEREAEQIYDAVSIVAELAEDYFNSSEVMSSMSSLSSRERVQTANSENSDVLSSFSSIASDSGFADVQETDWDDIN